MRAALILCLSLGVATALSAQERDSVFADRKTYETFVTDTIRARGFTDLILRLGGRDEYTTDEIATIEGDLRRAFPRDFTATALLRSETLDSGFVQEARAFWTEEQYGFYYALLHLRAEDVVVINFLVHTNVDRVLEKF